MGDPQPVQYREMQDRTRRFGLDDQPARAAEYFRYFGVHMALRFHQRRRQCDLKVELLSLALPRIRQVGDQQQPSSQLRFRLDHRRTSRGLSTGFAPVDNCSFYGSSLGVVMRHQPRLLICNFGEALLQHRSDARVKLAPPAAEERLVGGILKERVPEEIDNIRWRAAAVAELRLDERLQRLSQPLLGKPISNRADRLIRKLSAERRTDLSNLFCRT